jgi:hypothetical protein
VINDLPYQAITASNAQGDYLLSIIYYIQTSESTMDSSFQDVISSTASFQPVEQGYRLRIKEGENYKVTEFKYTE